MPGPPESHAPLHATAAAALQQRVAALEVALTAVRQRQHLLQAIFDTTTDAVFVKDREGHYVLVNPAFAALLRQPPAAILGRDDLALFPAAMAQRLRADDQQVMRLGEAQTFEEIGTSTGATRIYLSAKSPWRDAQGTVQGLIGIARDITDRKHAEMALQDSEERYRCVVDLSPDAIFVHSQDKVVMVNRAGMLLLGATRRDQLLGHAVLERVHPASRARAAAYLQRLAHGEPVACLEAQCLRLDGQVVEVEIAGAPIRYQQHAAIQIVVRDITPRKRAEALHAGRAQVLEMIATGAPLAAILTTLITLIEAQAPDMVGSILLLDADGTHLQHGAAPSLPAVYMQAIDGMAIGPCAGSCGTAAYRREPVIVTDVAHDPLWAAFRDLALPHGLRACWSTPILTSTGAVVGTFAMYYRTPRMPTPHDRHVIDMSTHLAGIAIERTRAEAALRASEERFRHLIEGSIQGMLIHRNHHPLFVNQAWAAIHGTTVEAVLHMESILPLVAPSDRERVLQDREACQRGAAAPLHEEYQGLHTDGTVLWLDHMVTVVPWGQELAMQSTVVDITERKRAAAALRLTERLAALGTLAAGIAHEINNPVGAILLAADNAGDARTVEEIRPFLESIIRQGERCDRIVQSILQFARQEPTEKWPCALNDLVRRAVEGTRAYALQHGVHLECTLADGVPALCLNPITIQQVLVNLLRNAIEAEAHTVWIQTAWTSTTVQCRVRDDGRGLTAEERQHLFDPFFTTRRQMGGTGLGLSLTYTILTEHGGTIDVQSQPGTGTTLTVTFPCACLAGEDRHDAHDSPCRR